MKKIIYLFLLICFSVSSNGQCVLDTFFVTKINCHQNTGLIEVIYDPNPYDNSFIEIEKTPKNVSGVNDATDLSVGPGHTCIRRSTGQVSCWGDNTLGQLGNGSTTEIQSTPVSVLGF